MGDLLLTPANARRVADQLVNDPDFALPRTDPAHTGPYYFGTSDLARRIRDAGLQLSADKDTWHTPPADALFLHRKLGDLYLLAARLRAKVDAAGLAARWF